MIEFMLRIGVLCPLMGGVWFIARSAHNPNPADWFIAGALFAISIDIIVALERRGK